MHLGNSKYTVYYQRPMTIIDACLRIIISTTFQWVEFHILRQDLASCYKHPAMFEGIYLKLKHYIFLELECEISDNSRLRNMPLSNPELYSGSYIYHVEVYVKSFPAHKMNLFDYI